MRNGPPLLVSAAADLAPFPRSPDRARSGFFNIPQTYFWFLEGLEPSPPKKCREFVFSPGREASKNSKIIKNSASIAKIQPIQHHRFTRVSKTNSRSSSPKIQIPCWEFQSSGLLVRSAPGRRRRVPGIQTNSSVCTSNVGGRLMFAVEHFVQCSSTGTISQKTWFWQEMTMIWDKTNGFGHS